jgi:hypothetical protein
LPRERRFQMVHHFPRQEVLDRISIAIDVIAGDVRPLNEKQLPQPVRARDRGGFGQTALSEPRALAAWLDKAGAIGPAQEPAGLQGRPGPVALNQFNRYAGAFR